MAKSGVFGIASSMIFRSASCSNAVISTFQDIKSVL